MLKSVLLDKDYKVLYQVVEDPLNFEFKTEDYQGKDEKVQLKMLIEQMEEQSKEKRNEGTERAEKIDKCCCG